MFQFKGDNLGFYNSRETTNVSLNSRETTNGSLYSRETTNVYVFKRMKTLYISFYNLLSHFVFLIIILCVKVYVFLQINMTWFSDMYRST